VVLSGATHDETPLQMPMQPQVGFAAHSGGVETQWGVAALRYGVWNVAQDNPAALHTSHDPTSEQFSALTQGP